MNMKCGKCGAEWKVDASRSSSLKLCPFCQESLETEKTSGWKFFDNTKELLAFIAAEYGNDALFGRKHFSDHSAPLMPQGQKNFVKQAYDCGSVKTLQDNMNADQARKEIAVKQAVGKLVDDYGTSEELAKRVIWEFTNAIGWGMPEPQSQSAPTLVQPVNISTPPPIPSPSADTEAGKLLTRAWLFAEDGDWKDATDYFNKVLDAEPTYAPAYLGLICVDLKISDEAKLANVKDPGSIISHKHYKRAVADPDIKSRLEGYVQTINARSDFYGRWKNKNDVTLSISRNKFSRTLSASSPLKMDIANMEIIKKTSNSSYPMGIRISGKVTRDGWGNNFPNVGQPYTETLYLNTSKNRLTSELNDPNGKGNYYSKQ